MEINAECHYENLASDNINLTADIFYVYFWVTAQEIS